MEAFQHLVYSWLNQCWAEHFILRKSLSFLLVFIVTASINLFMLFSVYNTIQMIRYCQCKQFSENPTAYFFLSAARLTKTASEIMQAWCSSKLLSVFSPPPPMTCFSRIDLKLSAPICLELTSETETNCKCISCLRSATTLYQPLGDTRSGVTAWSVIPVDLEISSVCLSSQQALSNV